MKKISFFILLLIFFRIAFGSSILIPMDESQKNHLKAYGIAYWVLQNGLEINWLLNYRGGSFSMDYSKDITDECTIRGVSFEVVSDAEITLIYNRIASPEVNMDKMKLEKAPKIAVYAPKTNQPWDDAVTLVLTYAEIPYTQIYDKEIVNGELSKYDWLHLHHEDFTGQYGKFYGAYRYASWYIENKKQAEADALSLGFKKVSKLKLFVAKRIKEFIFSGGFMFAMCSATDTYDIALAAENTDICASMFDGDPADPDCQKKLDYSKTLAFKNFTLVTNPYEYEFSDIDVTRTRKVSKENDYFTLFDFSAKWDPVPTMLCQNHTKIIKGFMGQTTAFNEDLIKSNVLIMGELKSHHEARYIHGEFGKGTWTFYGGHDPEDYQHFVGDPKTDLNMHPNSPGYRLILNNILFPAAKKKKRKT
ncbi:MAG: asparagine synthetase B [Chlorobi bacterium]|nr:asparagine synthetase B [Chlorobiota bacterium]